MPEESIIGLTKCDKWRERREKDIQKLVESAKFEIEKYDPTAMIALIPLDYWREALSCYQNGAYMAATLMCRSATELVVYLAVTRRINNPKKFSGGTIKVDYNFVEKEWRMIIEEAKKQRIINGKLESKINKIREKGNYVAHYGQRVDKSYLKYSVSRKINGGWIGRNESLQLIKQTTNVINAVLKNQAEASG